MKNIIVGFGLACQFFTAVPVNKSFAMDRKTITAMYAMLPVIGLLLGGVFAGLLYAMTEWTSLSPFFMTIVLVLAGIALTGGLHLDGWIDMSDAYFSYGDVAKRQVVLDDPRTGAFGVISFVSLIILKIAVIQEVLLHMQDTVYFIIVTIPFFARIAILLYFLTTSPSKEKGLGAYFKQQVNGRTLTLIVGTYMVMALLFAALMQSVIVLAFPLVLFLIILLYRKWTKKNFGGMSGDLLGALGEGTEVLLWLTLLLFI